MSDQEFQLKIRSLDNSQIELQVSETMLISDLKSLILSQAHIPIERQRLLYKGKLLRNASSLQSCNISAASTLQLVAYLERGPEDESISDLIRYTLDSIPNNYISSRRARDHRRRDLDVHERLESIRQNLQTMENLMANTRNFSKGQWVDVKDTVDQWLEAQVLEVNPTNSQVFVHYNGWPNRWDEWIDMNSPRIQHFKTNTYQSLTTPMHSPHPISPADAEGMRNLAPVEANDCLLQALGLLEQILVMLDAYNELSGQGSEEASALGSRLAPLMDRFGRMMSDIAGVIGGNQRNNDETASVSSSLITNESGISSGSAVRPQMQIPVMPPPAELALNTPRIGSDFDIHIHAFFAQRGLEQESRSHCWENFT